MIIADLVHFEAIIGDIYGAGRVEIGGGSDQSVDAHGFAFDSRFGGTSENGIQTTISESDSGQARFSIRGPGGGRYVITTSIRR